MAEKKKKSNNPFVRFWCGCKNAVKKFVSIPWTKTVNPLYAWCIFCGVVALAVVLMVAFWVVL